jgi:ribosome biogenesis GTPase / thiamine phosphate phosphatase
MELQELGFNEWFLQRLNESGKTTYHMARITNVSRGGYLVRNKDGEVLSEIAGEFAFSMESKLQYPVVGDWAFVQYYNDNKLAIIYDLLPRKTILRRKMADKTVDYQMIAANIDVAFIIQSCDLNFNPRRLERYLVMANDGHVEPVILLSKSDLVSQKDLDSKITEIRNTGINCKIIAYSVKTSSGLSQIQLLLQPGMTYCLLGSSGVGKTTLRNYLICRDEFEINPVREKDGKGRHTTSGRQLVLLDNKAMLIDTPGMRELGNIDIDSGIDESFSDILSLSESCRFNDCTHTHEVGCSVLEAVQSGSLSEAHYQDYLKLIKETEHYQMSYLEKRRKGRKFGQFIKSAMKRSKKK